MLSFNLKIFPEVVCALKDFTQEVANTLSNSLAIHVKYEEMDGDAFFEEVCKEQLLVTLQSDLDHFFFLLCDDRFGKEEVLIEPELAEPVLRAVSALRLQIRRLFLKDIPDSNLEVSTVNCPALSISSQKAYICYLFLATLQETLLCALDPSLEIG